MKVMYCSFFVHFCQKFLHFKKYPTVTVQKREFISILGYALTFLVHGLAHRNL